MGYLGSKLASTNQTGVLTFQVSVTQFLLSLSKKLTFRRYEKLTTTQSHSVSYEFYEYNLKQELC